MPNRRHSSGRIWTVGQFYGTLARLPVWLLAHLLATFMFTERGRDYKPVVPKLVSAVT